MIPAPIVLAAVAVGAFVVQRVVSRQSMRKVAERRGWQFETRADEIASMFTLPPFVELATLASPDTPPRTHVQVRDVARFAVAQSQVLAFTYEEGVRSTDTEPLSHQVVALHTRQALPRTMIRGGVDVYVLPTYEGLQRVREPRVPTRRGVVAVISEDPGRAATLSIAALVAPLEADPQLIIAADGDWIYAYRTATTHAHLVDQMLAALTAFARHVQDPPWPDGTDSTGYVYGAVD